MEYVPVSRRTESAPLRVLYVDFATHFGGAIVSMSEVASGVRHYGIEPHVLSFAPRAYTAHLFEGMNALNLPRAMSHLTRARFHDAIAGLNVPGVVRRAASLSYAVADYLYGFYFSLVILWLIHRRGIGILHLNNGLNANGLRAAAWAGIPCVSHMRGLIGSNTQRVLSRHRRNVDRAFACAIVISRAVLKSGLQAGITPRRMRLIHNSLDAQRFARPASAPGVVRARHGIDETDLVFGIFGRVQEWKGQLELVQAMIPFFEQSRAIKVMIVGDGSDSVEDRYWTALKQIVSSPPCSTQVILTGYQADVISYYHACDVVVHNSTEMEPFGRVVIEGMACSKPVIAMNEGGPCDIIEDGVDGLLVAPRSADALRCAISRLIDDDELRDRLGRKAREKVEREFDTRHVAAKVVTLYEEILAARDGIATA